jgi:HK97 family phage prohead protease
MELERKEFSIARVEIKAGKDNGAGALRTYLSTFGNWDEVRPIPERPTKGAFLKSLPEFKRRGFLAVGHDHNGLPEGFPVDAGEDSTGLWVDWKFHSTQAAQDARTVVKERVDNGLDVKVSMGYKVPLDEHVPMDDEGLKAQGIETGRLLKEIDLYEGSIVNIPANPRAMVTAVKSDEAVSTLSLADKADVLASGIVEFVDVVRKHLDIRTKEGRKISAARRAKLQVLCDALDGFDSLKTELRELLAETEPYTAEETVSADDVKRMYLDFLMWEANTDGVLIK